MADLDHEREPFSLTAAAQAELAKGRWILLMSSSCTLAPPQFCIYDKAKFSIESCQIVQWILFVLHYFTARLAIVLLFL